MDYFGYDKYAIADINGGEPDSVTLYDAGTKKYLFGQDDTNPNGVPVFATGTWNFFVEATEDYYYNGVESGDGMKVDRVPTQGGALKISNSFNTTASTQNEELDENGKKLVSVVMNNPSFASNKLGSLTFSVEIDGQTYPNNPDPLEGFLIGQDPKTDGTDFVTAGPIKLLNILRDPPGSTSYSWWESGQTITYYSMGAKGSHKLALKE